MRQSKLPSCILPVGSEVGAFPAKILDQVLKVIRVLLMDLGQFVGKVRNWNRKINENQSVVALPVIISFLRFKSKRRMGKIQS